VTALQEADGKTRIWVIDTQSKTVAPRDVSVISRTDGTVVLAGGVKSGEQVVTAGVNSLKPGQAVKLDEDSQ
jgi:multidrug efflux pump subunit AcrA (membrane-fusion protein)